MDLVENPKRGNRKLALENPIPILGHVPVEISPAPARKRASEGGLSHLPRTAEEDHLPAQILLDLAGQVPVGARHLPRSGPLLWIGGEIIRECF